MLQAAKPVGLLVGSVTPVNIRACGYSCSLLVDGGFPVGSAILWQNQHALMLAVVWLCLPLHAGLLLQPGPARASL